VRRAVPTETWDLVLEFDDGEIRLFDGSIARVERGWPELGHPQEFKQVTVTASGVAWPRDRSLSTAFLRERSVPVSGHRLAAQHLRVSYQNRAPTPEHPTHHVYGFYLHPFADAPFALGESIGGGHAETGGSRSFTLPALRAWPEWQEHLTLAGCPWAIPLVATAADQQSLLDILVAEIRHRAAHP
jgi:hypothetical protein